ncbi:MAG TPA: glutaredoxin family protein [Candidatus Baltobacterales bacterium]|nr:glutaredoxin family protein [Candidatus Baltobacterales bacterium]
MHSIFQSRTFRSCRNTGHCFLRFGHMQDNRRADVNLPSFTTKRFPVTRREVPPLSIVSNRLLKIYTTTSCGDCRMAKAVLDRAWVDYDEIDIDRTPDAVATVLEINGGYSTVPTILFQVGGCWSNRAAKSCSRRWISNTFAASFDRRPAGGSTRRGHCGQGA